MVHRFQSIRFLSALAAIYALSALTTAFAQEPEASSAILAPGLTLLFETAPFIPDEHQILEDDETGYVINGCKPFFGSDNAIPAAYLKRAQVLLDNQWFALDTSCMYTCEFCAFDATSVVATPNPGGAGYQLDGRFSDGAGTYFATWLVTPFGTARVKIQGGPQEMLPVHAITNAIQDLQELKTLVETGAVTGNEDWVKEILAALGYR